MRIHIRQMCIILAFMLTLLTACSSNVKQEQTAEPEATEKTIEASDEKSEMQSESTLSSESQSEPLNTRDLSDEAEQEQPATLELVTLDKGEKGVRNCMANWKEKYPWIQVTGVNESQESQDNQIVIVEKNGIKVAILNYTYGTNGIPMPSSTHIRM